MEPITGGGTVGGASQNVPAPTSTDANIKSMFMSTPPKKKRPLVRNAIKIWGAKEKAADPSMKTLKRAQKSYKKFIEEAEKVRMERVEDHKKFLEQFHRKDPEAEIDLMFDKTAQDEEDDESDEDYQDYKKKHHKREVYQNFYNDGTSW